MKIVSWNVNGLRAALGKGLENYLKEEKADLVCLQEIKARPEQISWEPPAGYHTFWNPAERAGYSGTLVFSRPEPRKVVNGVGEPEGDREGRAISLEFEDFHLVNVYTPNAKGDLSRLEYRTTVWDETFRDHVRRLNQSKPVIFTGDLNVAHREIDLARPKSNRKSAGFTDEERAAFGAHLEAGFVDTFRQLYPEQRDAYSWWSYRGGARNRNVGWRIDYVCCSAGLADRLKEAFIRSSVLGSDHCPVGIEIS